MFEEQQQYHSLNPIMDESIFYIVDNLNVEKHIYIQKTIGWLLKYAYFTYPDEILDYLVKTLSYYQEQPFTMFWKKFPTKLS